MIKLGCFLTTVDHPQKMEWLKDVTDSIDRQWINFMSKCVVFDCIHGNDISEELINYLSDHGWSVQQVHNHDRPMTLWHIINQMSECDYVLHAEDDIIIEKFPKHEDLLTIFDSELNIRTCGMLTPSLGGSTFKCEGGDSGDFSNIEKNILYQTNNMVCFIRDEHYASNYFFELGTLFINRKAFQECLEYAIHKCPNVQIEQALTSAWFNLGMYKDYYRATFCKPLLLEVWEKEPWRADGECRFMKCLDPNQGASLYGGKHNI